MAASITKPQILISLHRRECDFCRVIRSGNYKLLEFLEDGKIELYNLIEDVGEKNNLASQMPDLKKELHDKLNAWRNDIKAPMPSKNIKGANTPELPKKKKKQ